MGFEPDPTLPAWPETAAECVQELRKFLAPELITGRGVRFHAGTFGRNLGGRKVLLVTDAGVSRAGWARDVTDSLVEAGLDVTVFDQVTPNPRSEEIMHGADVFNESMCNLIFAVGGGSPMDCAKGIGIVVSNHRPILEFSGVDRVPIPIPPLICIPTTGGTAADLSQFAIVSDLEGRMKRAIVSKAIVPDVSLLDPEPLVTMPSDLTADTGIDALTHGIEAYVSNASSLLTDVLAIRAIGLMASSLVEAQRAPGDLTLRERTMWGSMLAGLAFSNASLGITHAMAHAVGGLTDQPHGRCNGVLLPHGIRYNFAAAPERYRAVGTAMGLDLAGKAPGEVLGALLAEIGRLRRDTGIPECLGDLGIRQADLPELARMTMTDSCCVTNPRSPTAEEVERIYEEAL